MQSAKPARASKPTRSVRRRRESTEAPPAYHWSPSCGCRPLLDTATPSWSAAQVIGSVETDSAGGPPERETASIAPGSPFASLDPAARIAAGTVACGKYRIEGVL